MKLILAIIQAADEADSVQELNKRGFFVTKLSTTGGFLKAKNTTLLIGTDDEKALFQVRTCACSILQEPTWLKSLPAAVLSSY